jgi:hypothetical protein
VPVRVGIRESRDCPGHYFTVDDAEGGPTGAPAAGPGVGEGTTMPGASGISSTATMLVT